jgi:hypothetical protein
MDLGIKKSCPLDVPTNKISNITVMYRNKSVIIPLAAIGYHQDRAVMA